MTSQNVPWKTGSLYPIELARALKYGITDFRSRQFLDGCEVIGLEEAWIEVQISKEWIAAYRMTLQTGVPVISELRIFPNEETRDRPGRWSAEYLGIKAKAPRGGITARLLRAITIGAHYKGTQEFLELAQQRGWHWLGEALNPRQPSKSSRTGGRKRKPDTFYARFAVAYDEALKRESRQPIREIAEKHKLSRERVTAIIHEARNRNLLGRWMQGKPGGELSDYARELLKKAPKKLVVNSVGKRPEKVEESKGKRRKTQKHQNPHG